MANRFFAKIAKKAPKSRAVVPWSPGKLFDELSLIDIHGISRERRMASSINRVGLTLGMLRYSLNKIPLIKKIMAARQRVQQISSPILRGRITEGIERTWSVKKMRIHTSSSQSAHLWLAHAQKSCHKGRSSIELLIHLKKAISRLCHSAWVGAQKRLEKRSAPIRWQSIRRPG